MPSTFIQQLGLHWEIAFVVQNNLGPVVPFLNPLLGRVPLPKKIQKAWVPTSSNLSSLEHLDVFLEHTLVMPSRTPGGGASLGGCPFGFFSKKHVDCWF